MSKIESKECIIMKKTREELEQECAEAAAKVEQYSRIT